MNTFTDEDIKLIEKFIDIKNRGYYCDGSQLTRVYNRVLGKNVNVTNCGSCIRQRVNELESALNAFKAKLKAVEASTEAEVNNVKEEENKALTEAEKMKERMAKVRAAKQQKNK